jgi:hypothetical protein
MDMEKHPVDQIFRDALYHQETSPPPESWSEIESRLKAVERKRYIILWRSVAAVTLVLVSLATGYFAGLNRQVQMAENKDTRSNQSLAGDKSGIDHEKALVEMQPIFNKIGPGTLLVDESHKETVTPALNNNKQDEVSDSSQRDGSAVQGMYQLLALEAGSLTLMEARPSIVMAEPEPMNYYSGKEIEISLDEEEQTTELNRWRLGGQASPLYAFRDVREKGGSSALFVKSDAAASSNVSLTSEEHPIFSYSSGLNLNYRISERLQVESGLSWSSTGMAMSASINSNQYAVDKWISSNQVNLSGNISETAASNSTGTIEVLDAFTSSTGTRLNEMSATTGTMEADITQYLGYLEIPLLLKYHLAGSKLKVGVHGGLITNILAENKVIYETGGQQVNAGPARDLRTLNYSGAIGLGASLPVGNRWQFNLEPSFRYFINPIYSTDSFTSHPYSFGVFTGLSYSF